MRQIAMAVFAALVLAPTAALAHTGIGAPHGFMHGFMHPIGGIDHILAMVTVGVFAAQIGGRALWLVPAAFVLVMAGGGVAGMAGISLRFVELGIASSVIVLGALVALGIRAPLAVAMGIVGLFAIFHGHAHGTEMPYDAAGLPYGLGFMAATALLHAIGIGVGFGLGQAGGRRAVVVRRVAGCLVAVTGLGLLAGVI